MARIARSIRKSLAPALSDFFFFAFVDLVVLREIMLDQIMLNKQTGPRMRARL
jgi:hypothetical protein